MPLDAPTAARLARDGERPSQVRHMCSGQHSVSILAQPAEGLGRHRKYWREDHPRRSLGRGVVAQRVRDDAGEASDLALDGCGVLTYAFPLREVARAYAFLADPAAVAGRSAASLAPALLLVRDAMLANPEMIGGTR